MNAKEAWKMKLCCEYTDLYYNIANCEGRISALIELFQRLEQHDKEKSIPEWEESPKNVVCFHELLKQRAMETQSYEPLFTSLFNAFREGKTVFTAAGQRGERLDIMTIVVNQFKEETAALEALKQQHEVKQLELIHAFSLEHLIDEEAMQWGEDLDYRRPVGLYFELQIKSSTDDMQEEIAAMDLMQSAISFYMKEQYDNFDAFAKKWDEVKKILEVEEMAAF